MPCPMCRKEFTIPEGGVEGLPKNFFVTKLLPLKVESVENLCEVCSETGCGDKKTMATVLCVDCNQKLCETCSIHHRKITATKDHQQIQIDAIADFKKRSFSSLAVCDKHFGEQIKIFCIECKVVICIMCYIELHNSHKCSDVNKMTDDLRQQMMSDVSSLTEAAKKLREMKTKIENEKKSVTDKVAEVENEINEHAKRLIEKVESDRQKLLEELAAAKQSRMKQIDHVGDEVEQQLVLVEGLQKYTRELASKGTSGDIARETSILHERADEMKALDVVQRELQQLGSCDVKFKSPPFVSETEKNVVGRILVKNLAKGLCRQCDYAQHHFGYVGVQRIKR